MARPEDLDPDTAVWAATMAANTELVLRGGMAARVKGQVVRCTIRLLRPAARHPGAIAHLPGFG